MKELKTKTNQELDDIFANEVLGHEWKSNVNPTADHNVVQLGIDRLNELGFIISIANHLGGNKIIDVLNTENKMDMVFSEWSYEFKSALRAITIACIVAVRSKT